MTEKKAELQRGLEARHIELIALGGTIGVGLFMGAASTLKWAGPSVLLAYIIAGLFVFFIMRSMGEMLFLEPVTGSFAVYAHRYMSPFFGYLTAWSYWFMWMAVGISEITAIGVYVQFWFPDMVQWIPALIAVGLVALVLFTAAGLMHSGGEMDTTRANLICDTLAEHFNLNPILILPAILVLLVSVFKLPALLGMGLTVVVSIVFAMVFQGVNFVELMNYAANGFTLSTGVDIVDPMLNRGGITSMTGLLITFMVASVMGGIITATGILDVLAKDVLLKFIKSRGVLVTVTLIYCYIVNFLTAGGQTVAIIVTEQTFEDAFDRMGIHRRVLSRTLEDAGTLSAPIVPWGVATLYVMEVLGCGTEYIPYCWFIFIVPIFSILCAFSGFGIWDKDGNKMWGRKKAAAK